MGSLDSYLYGIDSGTNTGLASSPWPKFLSNTHNTAAAPDSIPVIATVNNLYGFHVSAPYPNPFNTSTVFQYSVPGNCHVKLVIYDILGRKIKIIEDKQVNAGTHEVVWDATDEDGVTAGSGVYLYQLKTNNFYAITKGKVLFIR